MPSGINAWTTWRVDQVFKYARGTESGLSPLSLLGLWTRPDMAAKWAARWVGPLLATAWGYLLEPWKPASTCRQKLRLCFQKGMGTLTYPPDCSGEFWTGKLSKATNGRLAKTLSVADIRTRD